MSTSHHAKQINSCCPYAMRARLALYASGVAVELREVSLRDKPASMLVASPKGSVPVLVLPDGQVIDESWDIMQWALHLHDPEDWLGENDSHVDAAIPLISENDTTFKFHLNRYKYPDRYPEYPQRHYRSLAEVFLLQLENRLSTSHFLLGEARSVADVALFPFIRQFAKVDMDWFSLSRYSSQQRWLKDFLASEQFIAIMKKYAIWHPEALSRYHGALNYPRRINLPVFPSMYNLIISTIVFFIAAWFAHRYLDGQGIPKGMTRGVMVFLLASLVSWGSGDVVDWVQVKIEGPQTASQNSGDLSQLLKAVSQQ